MLKKVTIFNKAIYYINTNVPEEAAIGECLGWFYESEPSIEISEPIAECELGMKCPYSHNCSECK